MSVDQSLDNNSNHWEQFEQFRKKITQECQSEEKHFKTKRDSYTSLEKIRKSSVHDESGPKEIQFAVDSKPPILVQPSEGDRIIKLRIENQELKEKLEKYEKNEQTHQANSDELELIKQAHAKQLKSQKEYYEVENNQLKNKINSFNEELEELKKVYKEKNMKLYNLVLQLEQEKQELIDKNIQLLENRQQSSQQDIHHLVEERTRVLSEQIYQLEERNAKLQVEKSKIEEKYMNQLSGKQQSMQKTLRSERSDRKDSKNCDTDRKSVEKLNRSSIHKSECKPPMPTSISQSFEQLPPAQKSILKSSKLNTSSKENLQPLSNSKILDTPQTKRKSARAQSSVSKKATQPQSQTQKVVKKKQIYSKIK
ncbi:unnamed protein product [Paramecium sonneborni]|uniref:Uncharacterized protein n=1 Tax=Paramecium sonneborni TaxID=65129 RepID=A0A8S1QEG4_9CILI|nr:unnamed protein product [Paramecium sonneborni]